MRLILSFAALYLSVVLLQLSNGGLGPVDALSGFELAFTTEQIDLLGSAHFIGFLSDAGGHLGSWERLGIQLLLPPSLQLEPSEF